MVIQSSHDASRRPRRLGALAVGLILAAVAAGPVAAAKPVVTKVIDIKFENVQHFDADPSCGSYSIAATEIATGNAHLIIADDGQTLKIAFGETFKILVIPDDPSLPTQTRKGAGAGHFVLQRDGDVIFHESFHDYGPAAWNPDAKIRFTTTFTTRNGEVIVDRFLGHDMPPDGC